MILFGLAFLILALACAFLARTLFNYSSRDDITTGDGMLAFVGAYLLIMATLFLSGMAGVAFFARQPF